MSTPGPYQVRLAFTTALERAIEKLPPEEKVKLNRLAQEYHDVVREADTLSTDLLGVLNAVYTGTDDRVEPGTFK